MAATRANMYFFSSPVQWMTEIFWQLLKDIVARRGTSTRVTESELQRIQDLENDGLTQATEVIKEVVDILSLPDFDGKKKRGVLEQVPVEIDSTVADTPIVC